MNLEYIGKCKKKTLLEYFAKMQRNRQLSLNDIYFFILFFCCFGLVGSIYLDVELIIRFNETTVDLFSTK